jgi:hypothetical protein
LLAVNSVGSVAHQFLQLGQVPLQLLHKVFEHTGASLAALPGSLLADATPEG